MIQLSFFDETLELELELEVTWEVLYRGAGAAPPHTFDAGVPWKVLAFVEDQLRYDQCGARLDCTDRHGTPQNGPQGTGDLHMDSRAITGGGRKWTWPRVLAGLRLVREREPEIARVRDLAEAYHFLDYYGRVYAGQPVSGSWRADRFVEQIARDVLDLGGDPTVLEPKTDYMAAGIAAAVGIGAAP